MDSVIIYQAANDLVQSTGTRNIKRIARSCSLDISETPRFKDVLGFLSLSSAYFTAFFSPPRMNLDATLPRHFSRSQSKPWIVLITRLPKSFGIQQKKAGPSAWICTTSYLPNALQSAAKKEELTAASLPDVKIGTKKFSKKAKK